MVALAIYYAYLGVVSASAWRLAAGRAADILIIVHWMVRHA